MGKIKSKSITKMKLSAINNLPLSTNCRMFPIQSHCPLFDIFNKEGWVLHTRSKFHFNNKQRTLLCQYLIDGEKSGKETPEGVHMLWRKDLQPQDYVTPQQIKSLFSCWTRKKASAPPKIRAFKDNTHEDVMEGMKMILWSIYYCKCASISV